MDMVPSLNNKVFMFKITFFVQKFIIVVSETGYSDPKHVSQTGYSSPKLVKKVTQSKTRQSNRLLQAEHKTSQKDSGSVVIIAAHQSSCMDHLAYHTILCLVLLDPSS